MGFLESDLLLLLSIILIIILNLNGLTTTARPTYVYHYCSDDNYSTTAKSSNTYQTNLNLFLSSLSSFHIKLAINKAYYYNETVGQNPDSVYGSVQCRNDLVSEICRDCVDTAAQEITQSDRCPNSKQAIVWYEECMLRYSNQSYFSIMQEHLSVYLIRNIKNVTKPRQFDLLLNILMDNLVAQAVSNSSSNLNNLFASGELALSSRKIYGLVQCTSDLLNSSCNTCLRGAIDDLPRCCNGKAGGRVVRPSCNFRYDIYPFYESKMTAVLAPSPLPHPPPTNSFTINNNKKMISSKLLVIIVVASAIIVISAISVWYFCLRTKKVVKKFEVMHTAEDIDEFQTAESLQFDFNTIRAATDNFSHANKLGQGGFGSVYKGTLSDGQEIAVKRLSRNSCQGKEEFKNEVVLAVKLQHKNLVRLLGFCLDGEEKLLIYEFMPNASLDQFIFDLVKRTYLDWERRYKIIEGIARGLLYLHEDSRLKIIHRDLKVSNVLLDADMNLKISDFGMARMFLVDQTQANTNRIVGT